MGETFTFCKDTGPFSEMFRKLIPVARTVAATARTNNVQAVRCMSAHGHEKPEVEVVKEHMSSMDFLPVPQGSWQEAYDKKNSRLNIMLGSSALFFVLTIFAAKQAGVWLFHRTPDYKKVK